VENSGVAEGRVEACLAGWSLLTWAVKESSTGFAAMYGITVYSGPAIDAQGRAEDVERGSCA
jgi:hypothetical protein